MTALAVAAAQWRLPADDRMLLQQSYLPWALRAGTRCADLMCLYYERHFEVRRGNGRAWGRRGCVQGEGE